MYAADVSGKMYAPDAKTGKTLWTAQPGGRNATSAPYLLYVADGKVVLHNADSEDASQLIAYDTTTRKQVWQASLDDVSPSTFSPAMAGGYVVVGANKGVQGVALANGKKVGSLDQPDESRSIPDPVVDSAGRTYLTDSSSVYAYD